MNTCHRLSLFISLALVCAALLLTATAESSANGALVPIDPTHFPDDIFRAYVSDNYDADSDGTLSETEIADVTWIYVDDMNIKTLVGIEYFTELLSLDCSNNQLSALDVSNCVALDEMWCRDNQLTALDVSGCVELTILDCDNNLLTTLDVSNCEWLLSFSCDDNQLSELDLSNCHIREMSCRNNWLTTLCLSSDILYDLNCTDNSLSSLDISHCPQLLYVYNKKYYNKSEGHVECYAERFDIIMEYDHGVVINGREAPYSEIDLSGIKAIEDEAFENAGISYVSIENCSSIGSRAFADCPNLRMVYIECPRDHSMEIAEDAFEGCDNLYVYTYNDVVEKWSEEHGIPCARPYWW